MPVANKDAITHFKSAAASEDDDLRALALAGLTMAYCQNVHRFNKDSRPWAALADSASAQAIEIDDRLEESHFARGWAHQVCERWEDALDEYERVVALPGDSPKEKQLKSFARNNAGYVVLTKLDDSKRAEELFQSALDLYPNKMAHSNLAAIAKRQGDHEDAARRLAHALKLDASYVNALNELAVVKIGIAASARDRGEEAERVGALTEANTLHERALVLVCDEEYRTKLREALAVEYECLGFELEAEGVRAVDAQALFALEPGCVARDSDRRVPSLALALVGYLLVEVGSLRQAGDLPRAWP